MTTYTTNAAEFRICKVRENEAPSVAIATPDDAAAYWRANIDPQIDSEKEHLVALLLNTKNECKGHVFISIGSLNETLAHPREIFRPAIVAAAYSFILMHNHPSGDSSPSDADHRLTHRIKEAGELLRMPLRDHVIVGNVAGERPRYSFREAGVI